MPGPASPLLLQILGQFNLGFILARHGDDVFIVDQHAAAEKTTFERLQRTVVLTRQPLLVPMALPPGLLLPVDQLLIRWDRDRALWMAWTGE